MLQTGYLPSNTFCEPFLDPQAEHFSVRVLKQAITGARINLRQQFDCLPSALSTAGIVIPFRTGIVDVAFRET
jgi:hypothetical protein